MGKRNFSQEEKKKESFLRVANALYSHWRVTDFNDKEKLACGGHSRLFEVLIPDAYIIAGESLAGREYREHVVPINLIRNHAYHMFNNGYLIEDVANMIENNLYIILITTKERDILDKSVEVGGKGWKYDMPDEWKFGDDAFARLNQADIKFKLYKDVNVK